MDRLETYPPGAKVRIKEWPKQPQGWNNEMYHNLTGKVFTVKRADPTSSDNSFSYWLDGMKWNWRHVDLELVSLPKVEPNTEFRRKKCGLKTYIQA